MGSALAGSGETQKTGETGSDCQSGGSSERLDATSPPNRRPARRQVCSSPPLIYTTDDLQVCNCGPSLSARPSVCLCDVCAAGHGHRALIETGEDILHLSWEVADQRYHTVQEPLPAESSSFCSFLLTKVTEMAGPTIIHRPSGLD